MLMDGANCGGRESEAAGPGAAELVKERLNVHLPSPEMLIKEERRQVPASQLPPADTHVHTPPCILINQSGLFLFPPVRF